MVLGQLFITDLTLSKRRLNEGIYKTLHNQAFAYYHKRSSICMPNYDITVALEGCIAFFETTACSASTALSLEWIFANTKK